MDRTPTYDDTPNADWRVDEDRVVSIENRAELAAELIDRANGACTETTWLAEQARDGFVDPEQVETALAEARALVAALEEVRATGETGGDGHDEE